MEREKKNQKTGGNPEVYTVRCQDQATNLDLRYGPRKQLRDLLQQIRFTVTRMSWQKVSEQPKTPIVPPKSQISDRGQRS